MLVEPAKKRIWFAEFDVMKSVEAQLRIGYSNRSMESTTDADEQWWRGKVLELDKYSAQAVQTDREDLRRRTRLMRDELRRIGGITPAS